MILLDIWPIKPDIFSFASGRNKNTISELAVHQFQSCYSFIGTLASLTSRASSPKFRQEGGIVGDPRCRRLNFSSSPVRKPGVAGPEATAGFLTRLLIGLNASLGGSPIILASCQNFGDDERNAITLIKQVDRYFLIQIKKKIIKNYVNN